MFGKVLVTATLLDSMDFAKSAPPAWKESGMRDFVAKIKREPITYPDWVQKGMDFEAHIYDTCRRANNAADVLNQGSDNFKKVASECYGARFQCKLQGDIEVGSEKVFLFGFSDAETPNLTIDLKTCLKWKGERKYLDKNQHKMYLYLNKKPAFRYIVAEWKDPDNSNEINSVHSVDYTNPGHAALEGYMIDKIAELFEFIRSQDLWNDYYYTFSKNR